MADRPRVTLHDLSRWFYGTREIRESMLRDIKTIGLRPRGDNTLNDVDAIQLVVRTFGDTDRASELINVVQRASRPIPYQKPEVAAVQAQPEIEPEDEVGRARRRAELANAGKADTEQGLGQHQETLGADFATNQPLSLAIEITDEGKHTELADSEKLAALQERRRLESLGQQALPVSEDANTTDRQETESPSEGRPTRRERRERRAERRREWAGSRERKRDEAIRPFNEAHGDIAFWQQPAAPNTSLAKQRERLRRGVDKSVEHDKMARHHLQKAEGLEREIDQSIYSDDADVGQRLEGRIAERTAERDRIKAGNANLQRLLRSKPALKTSLDTLEASDLRDLGYNTKDLKDLMFQAKMFRSGLRSIPLTNINASIRRDTQRLGKAQADSKPRVEQPVSEPPERPKTGVEDAEWVISPGAQKLAAEEAPGDRANRRRYEQYAKRLRVHVAGNPPIPTYEQWLESEAKQAEGRQRSRELDEISEQRKKETAIKDAQHNKERIGYLVGLSERDREGALARGEVTRAQYEAAMKAPAQTESPQFVQVSEASSEMLDDHVLLPDKRSKQYGAKSLREWAGLHSSHNNYPASLLNVSDAATVQAAMDAMGAEYVGESHGAQYFDVEGHRIEVSPYAIEYVGSTEKIVSGIARPGNDSQGRSVSRFTSVAADKSFVDAWVDPVAFRAKELAASNKSLAEAQKRRKELQETHTGETTYHDQRTGRTFSIKDEDIVPSLRAKKRQRLTEETERNWKNPEPQYQVPLGLEAGQQSQPVAPVAPVAPAQPKEDINEIVREHGTDREEAILSMLNSLNAVYIGNKSGASDYRLPSGQYMRYERDGWGLSELPPFIAREYEGELSVKKRSRGQGQSELGIMRRMF